MAKPIGVAQHRGRLIVVCDDGSVYRSSNNTFGADEIEWELLPPVPNTEAEEFKLRSHKQETGGMRWVAGG